MKIKAILFDCVGPLLIKNQISSSLENFDDIDNQCGSVTNEDHFWKEIAFQYKYSPEKISDVKKSIARNYIKNEPMWKFLQSLNSTYKKSIINNGTYSILLIWIKKYHMNSLFDLILNSAKIGIPKPDPRIFKIAMEKLNVSPDECIFIDDSITNVDAAKKIGIYGIHYDPKNHHRFLLEIDKILGK